MPGISKFHLKIYRLINEKFPKTFLLLACAAGHAPAARLAARPIACQPAVRPM